MQCHCHHYEVFAINLFSVSPGYKKKQQQQRKKKFYQRRLFCRNKEGEPKPGKSHRRMSVNQERKSQGFPEDGNEAILNK